MSVVKCTPEQRNHIDATGRKFFAPFKGIRMRNPGSQEPGEVKSGIRNAAQGVPNPLKNDPESSNWNLQIIKQQKSGFSCFESCKVGNSPQFQFNR